MNKIVIAFVCTWILLGLLFFSYVDYTTNNNERLFRLSESLEELESKYTVLETTASDEFDNIMEQRVHDAFTFWVLSLNKTQTEDLKKMVYEIQEEDINLECMFDARDYFVDKNSFKFYSTQSLGNFVSIKPKGITCWKDWEETDCKEFCED